MAPLYHEVAILVEFLLLLLLMVAAAAAAPPPTPTTRSPPQPTSQTKPGCPNLCGNFSIPYPFGLHHECYLDDSFHITCSESNEPVLPRSNATVLNISIIHGQLTVSSLITHSCFDKQGHHNETQKQSFDFSPFTVSDSGNHFTLVGCETSAVLIETADNDHRNISCSSHCDEIDDVDDEDCSGKGCCQRAMPKGVKAFEIVTTFSDAHGNHYYNYSPCSFAFVARDKYTFRQSYLQDLQKRTNYPMVLDWAIGDTTCEEAKKNGETYACKSENSECYNSTNGGGYRCRCYGGYQGNPYLSHGCQDINECEDPRLHQCVEKSVCKNTKGNYTCSCPKGLYGDGRKDGMGCLSHKQLPLKIIYGVSISFLILLLVVSWVYFGLRRRRLIRLREKYFKENGGYLFQQKLSQCEGGSMRVAKIFTEKELKRATDNYHESRILGIGGQGTVYKGILTDNQIVAVKKAKLGGETQVEGFINEVIILSQINHRNVVKLLGCCLETRVPLLVYEFVTNGSLFDLMHNEEKYPSTLITWETRLKIATEVAEALSYMHSAASTPIIHRDIKSANILLDNNYTAKVSDFGASKLMPLDETELTTLVQGTLGYLDPEYFQTSLLTEKSDVYSFGVVLVELLTRKKAVCFRKREEERNLAMHFVTSIQEHRLLEVLDQQLLSEKNIEELKAVTMLARNCVSVKGEERPTMKEVAFVLQSLCPIERSI